MASFAGCGTTPASPGDGAAPYHFTIARNAPFHREFTLENDGSPLDLTSYEVHSQIRAAGRRRTLLVDFEDLAGALTIDGPAGTITLHLTIAQVADLPITPAEWDLLIQPIGGDPEPVMRGHVRIIPGVTSG